MSISLNKEKYKNKNENVNVSAAAADNVTAVTNSSDNIIHMQERTDPVSTQTQTEELTADNYYGDRADPRLVRYKQAVDKGKMIDLQKHDDTLEKPRENPEITVERYPEKMVVAEKSENKAVQYTSAAQPPAAPKRNRRFKLRYIILALIVLGAGRTVISKVFGNLGKMLPIPARTFIEYAASGDINTLNIEISADDVNISESSVDRIIIDYYDYNSNPMYDISESGDSLTFRRNNNTNVNLDDDYYCINITVPEGTLEDLTAKSSSGAISIEGIDIDRSIYSEAGSGAITMENTTAGGSISLRTTAGSIEVDDVKSGSDFSITASSGNINLNRLRAEKSAEFWASSGNIQLDDLKVGSYLTANSSAGTISISDIITSEKIEILTTSGDISASEIESITDVKLQSSSGSLTGSDIKANKINRISSSGETKLKDVDISDTISVEASSGDVEIEMIDNKSNYSISVNTTSGDSNIGNTSNAGAAKNIVVNTTSGDVNIEFNR
ncbi:MAG: DUF4097 family beta strand repeat protein [Oscillospiraceae bacterium]|nr:DUF4097 family beta strand repeat protein [Oscillospiraceae bacterium]